MPDIDTDTPLLDLIERMTEDSIATSQLDREVIAMVRLAALVAVGAPPVSYLANIAVLDDVDLDDDQARGVLAAIAPIVGTPHVVTAAGNIARALGLAIAVSDVLGPLED
jgi:hypothetical protein